MPQASNVIAVLVSNPALGAILGSVLAASPSLRVRTFESILGLSTYLRLAPVDVVVCDFDGSEPADAVARQLRDEMRPERRTFQTIALASLVTPELKRLSIRAGIDEIIVKPMSPKYLLERVLSRLGRIPSRVAPTVPAPTRPMQPGLGDNVIPLFGHQHETLH